MTLASDIPAVERFDYIGIDNQAAGRLAGFLMGRFLTGCGEDPLGEEAAPRWAFLPGASSIAAIRSARWGFATSSPKSSRAQRGAVREDQDDTEHAYRETGALLRDYPGLRGVYNAGAGNRGLVPRPRGKRTRPRGRRHRP